MSSICFCVTKCPGPYMLLMYQLRSSSAEIGVCPGASQIRVDVVVWAIVSEYAVDGKKLFFEGVWLCVCAWASLRCPAGICACDVVVAVTCQFL